MKISKVESSPTVANTEGFAKLEEMGKEGEAITKTNSASKIVLKHTTSPEKPSSESLVCSIESSDDEHLLKTFVNSSGWALQAYDGAVSYARRVMPYNLRMAGSKAHAKLIQCALVEAFSDILWPQLESRGWVRDVSNGKPCFQLGNHLVRL